MNPRQKNSHYSLRSIFFGLALFGLVTPASFAEVVAIDVSSRETLAEAGILDSGHVPGYFSNHLAALKLVSTAEI
mgnify:CR=1 FL=1